MTDLDGSALCAAATNNVIGSELVPMSWNRQLKTILALPFMVTVANSALLVVLFKPVRVSWQKWELLVPVLMILGMAMILLGLSLMISKIWLFANTGRGMLVSWDPTEKLVVKGSYRFARNPMISGVVFVLFGEAMILGLVANWLWFVIFTVGNMIYINSSF